MLEKAEYTRVPTFGMGSPDWCHHHRSKMRLEATGRDSLIISGSAAEVKISRLPDVTYGEWLVEWEIIQSPHEKTSGNLIFSADELRAAFGLTEQSGLHGHWLIERYGGDSAAQGRYIRYKDYLNIPGPGTGHDGDPNVSIHLDGDIKEAILRLLS